MHWLDMLPGIIWAGFMGLMMGNFATNPIYRLPRSEPLFIKDPYCGDCNAKLMPRDLFPVLSWLMTRGRCRYCGAGVPGAYTITEALIGCIYILCYLKYGFSEMFLLVSFGMTAFLMLGMMLTLDNFFSDRTLTAVLVFGALARTLQEHSIYGFTGGAFMGMIAGTVAWKCSGRPMIRDAAAFPPYLKLLVAVGVWLMPLELIIVFVMGLLACLFRKKTAWIVEWSIIACALGLVLIRTVQ